MSRKQKIISLTKEKWSTILRSLNKGEKKTESNKQQQIKPTPPKKNKQNTYGS